MFKKWDSVKFLFLARCKWDNDVVEVADFFSDTVDKAKKKVSLNDNWTLVEDIESVVRFIEEINEEIQELESTTNYDKDIIGKAVLSCRKQIELLENTYRINKVL